MKSSAVLHHQSKDVHTIAFQRDEQGNCDTEQVRSYFANEFLAATMGIKRLVIDLRGVASLDSASLGPLVQKLKDMQDLDGSLALCNVTSPALCEIFALTRFDKVFAIYPSLAQALTAVSS